MKISIILLVCGLAIAAVNVKVDAIPTEMNEFPEISRVEYDNIMAKISTLLPADVFQKVQGYATQLAGLYKQVKEAWSDPARKDEFNGLFEKVMAIVKPLMEIKDKYLPDLNLDDLFDADSNVESR
uniref:X1.A.B7.1 n=1 Tax=Schmidtea mediterranea TaxID=79327 RepID=V9XRM1_SCHMD|nr:X1.A.B7.1 [Schmidtea mediterranea]